MKPYPGAPEPDPPSEPMERVKRGYNEASFRQAAFELEQVEEMQLAALPPAERAQRARKARKCVSEPRLHPGGGTAVSGCRAVRSQIVPLPMQD